MGLFKQILYRLHSRRVFERASVVMDGELVGTSLVPVKVQNVSFGGAQIQIMKVDPEFVVNQRVGEEISLNLSVPERIRHLILCPSPVMAKAKVVRRNPVLCQLGVVWVDIHPVVLSALIRCNGKT